MLRETLKNIVALSKERNKYAHAMAVVHINLNTKSGELAYALGLVNRDNDVPMDAVAIELLADPCGAVGRDWIGHQNGFTEALQAARKTQDQANKSSESQT